MNGWAEKTWAGAADGSVGPQPPADLPAVSRTATLQTAGISGAMFDVEDAQVQQQVQTTAARDRPATSSPT